MLNGCNDTVLTTENIKFKMGNRIDVYEVGDLGGGNGHGLLYSTTTPLRTVGLRWNFKLGTSKMQNKDETGVRLSPLYYSF